MVNGTDDLSSSPYVQRAIALGKHNAPVSAMAWSPDGSRLASSSIEGEFSIWRGIEGQRSPPFASKAYPPYTSLAWSHDGRFVACGSAGNGVGIWEGRTGELAHVEAETKHVSCVAWSPTDLRLAFAGSDRKVYFCGYERGFSKVDRELGTGHDFEILSMAWDPEGRALATGTSGGTIGIWLQSAVDNQLRNTLRTPGDWAHNDSTFALAWSQHTAQLASASKDGRVRLWDADQTLVQTLDLHDVPLDLGFAADGAMLIVQCLDKIRFLKCKPLVEIAAWSTSAALEPARTPMAIDRSGSNLATVDCRDHSITVWSIDFVGLLKSSEITHRTYRAVGVAVLGESKSGRTNVARALTAQPFRTDAPQHDFEIHRLRLAPVTRNASEAETRELAIWDLPSGSDQPCTDHALVQRLHAGEHIVNLVVLEAQAGRRVLDNLESWRRLLQQHRWVPRERPSQFIVVVTKSDRIHPPASANEMGELAGVLGVELAFAVSAKLGQGIEDVRSAVLAAIDWNEAARVESVEIFQYLQAFVAREQARGKYLCTLPELHAGFRHLHGFLGSEMPDEVQFRVAVRFLETLGQIDRFDGRDEVLLRPEYFHTYALAMISGAQRDPQGMGRLPLEQAELGYGMQFEVPESQRVRDRRQELRLLSATIDDLVQKGVAQRVSTDGVTHLVFPRSLTRVWADPPPKDERAIQCKYSGPVEDIYSSLVVRLLSLDTYYPKQDLYSNGGTFDAASGGSCGLVLEVEPGASEGELSIFYADEPSEPTKAAFSELVHRHVQERARSLDWQLTAGASAGASRVQGPAEVFFCHDFSDAQDISNVGQIASELSSRGIRVWWESHAGDTGRERSRQLRSCRVAVVLLNGPMGVGLQRDCKELIRRGCPLIPVVLPDAPKRFRIPDLLRRHTSVDFRNLASHPTERLLRGIEEYWCRVAGEDGVVRAAVQHVFISYCHEDVELVQELRQAISERGHSVWSDEMIGTGEAWRQSVQDAINASYAVIICLSPALAERHRSVTYWELEHAIALYREMPPARTFIIPVRLWECPTPKVQIRANLTLDSIQHFDCHGRVPKGRALDALIVDLDRAREQAGGA